MSSVRQRCCGGTLSVLDRRRCRSLVLDFRFSLGFSSDSFQALPPAVTVGISELHAQSVRRVDVLLRSVHAVYSIVFVCVGCRFLSVQIVVTHPTLLTLCGLCLTRWPAPCCRHRTRKRVPGVLEGPAACKGHALASAAHSCGCHDSDEEHPVLRTHRHRRVRRVHGRRQGGAARRAAGAQRPRSQHAADWRAHVPLHRAVVGAEGVLRRALTGAATCVDGNGVWRAHSPRIALQAVCWRACPQCTVRVPWLDHGAVLLPALLWVSGCSVRCRR